MRVHLWRLVYRLAGRPVDQRLSFLCSLRRTRTPTRLASPRSIPMQVQGFVGNFSSLSLSFVSHIFDNDRVNSGLHVMIWLYLSSPNGHNFWRQWKPCFELMPSIATVIWDESFEFFQSLGDDLLLSQVTQNFLATGFVEYSSRVPQVSLLHGENIAVQIITKLL